MKPGAQRLALQPVRDNTREGVKRAGGGVGWGNYSTEYTRKKLNGMLNGFSGLNQMRSSFFPSEQIV